MSSSVKVIIDIDYEENVSAGDLRYIEKLVDKTLQHVDFAIPDNPLSTEYADPVRFEAKVMNKEQPRGSTL